TAVSQAVVSWAAPQCATIEAKMTDPERPEVGTRPEPEPALLALLDARRRTWPDFAVSDRQLADYLRARTGPNGPPPLAHAGDLLLACACGSGIVAARGALSALC